MKTVVINIVQIFGLIIYFGNNFGIIRCKTMDEQPIFLFPEYDYKDTTKNENTFHEYELACEQNSKCAPLSNVGKIRCIRECLSPTCYREIYQFDELEEGEIDVRLNSFKGCFIQRMGKSRN